MTDDRFEEFLRREAGSYNEPPALVPRDEMFAEIRRKRDRGPATGDRKPGPRAWRPAMALIGMAATLVLGVAIGRYAMARREAATPRATALGASPGAAASGAAEPSPLSGRADSSTYARAASAQLVRAEALLTAYNAAGRDTALDRQFSSWARDLLGNTRLLLDSPAAGDPARRRLLQDLELVLVQMVQRAPPAGAADERAQIDRSMERTQVLTRLRSALPAAHIN